MCILTTFSEERHLIVNLYDCLLGMTRYLPKTKCIKGYGLENERTLGSRGTSQSNDILHEIAQRKEGT